jgi:hypothetical protein
MQSLPFECKEVTARGAAAAELAHQATELDGAGHAADEQARQDDEDDGDGEGGGAHGCSSGTARTSIRCPPTAV